MWLTKQYKSNCKGKQTRWSGCGSCGRLANRWLSTTWLTNSGWPLQVSILHTTTTCVTCHLSTWTSAVTCLREHQLSPVSRATCLREHQLSPVSRNTCLSEHQLSSVTCLCKCMLTTPYKDHVQVLFNGIFITADTGEEGNTIGSVCLSHRPPVYTQYLLNQVTANLDL